MTKEEALAYGLSLGPTYEDQPFTKNGGGNVWLTLRHLSNHKIFLICSERAGKVYLALKGAPELNFELAEQFEGITPAWHMNKQHWIDVRLESDVGDAAIRKLIGNSYALTAK